MSAEETWAMTPLFETLRPAAGWKVKHAVLATYSLDLTVLTAALCALAGFELSDLDFLSRKEQSLRARVDFIQANSFLRDKVRVLTHPGRLSMPRLRALGPTTNVVALLDSYLVRVDCPLATWSWHPKVSFIEFENAEGKKEYRCWLGSKNLTRDRSWDAGLAISGSIGLVKGSPIKGLDKMATVLARTAKWPQLENIWREEISRVQWEHPQGIRIKSISLFGPEESRAPLEWPEGVQEVIAVSPFVDYFFLKELNRFGLAKDRQWLVSTLPDLQKIKRIAPTILESFELLSRAIPENWSQENRMFLVNHTAKQDQVEADVDVNVDVDIKTEAVGDALAEENTEFETESEDFELGLHAKILAFRHKLGYRLWMGSANLTKRGYFGPNAEVIADLEIEEVVWRGLKQFTQGCRMVDLATLQTGDSEEPDHLADLGVNEVVINWDVIQREDKGSCYWVAKQLPHPQNSQLQFEVRRVDALDSQWTLWPRGQKELHQPHTVSEPRSDFVQLRLTLAEESFHWIDIAPWQPRFAVEDRDRDVLARLLDWRTLMLLLTRQSGGSFNEEALEANLMSQRAGKSAHAASLASIGLTIEQILRTWVREPDALVEMSKYWADFGQRMMENARHKLQSEDTDMRDEGERELELLEEFERIWRVIQPQLAPTKQRGGKKK